MGHVKTIQDPVGYAAIIAYDNDIITSKESIVKQIVSGSSNTTNNIMEMLAITKSLEFVYNVLTNSKNANKISTNNKINVKLYADSEYCIKGITIWSEGWKKKNFKGVKNEELWRNLLQIVENINNIDGVNLTFNKVKGHSGDTFNDMVDELASNEALKYAQIVDTRIDFDI